MFCQLIFVWMENMKIMLIHHLRKHKKSFFTNFVFIVYYTTKLQISKKSFACFSKFIITVDDHRNQICVIIITSPLPFFSVKPAIKINFQVYRMQINESHIHNEIHMGIKVSIFYAVLV